MSNWMDKEWRQTEKFYGYSDNNRVPKPYNYGKTETEKEEEYRKHLAELDARNKQLSEERKHLTYEQLEKRMLNNINDLWSRTKSYFFRDIVNSYICSLCDESYTSKIFERYGMKVKAKQNKERNKYDRHTYTLYYIWTNEEAIKKYNLDYDSFTSHHNGYEDFLKFEE